jgi:hypothetical protein
VSGPIAIIWIFYEKWFLYTDCFDIQNSAVWPYRVYFCVIRKILKLAGCSISVVCHGRPRKQTKTWKEEHFHTQHDWLIMKLQYVYSDVWK